MIKYNLEQLDCNPFQKIGRQWMLVTAGSLDSWNTMTASWGALGHLWNRDVAVIYVRKQRYTYEFVESSKFFTVSFFPEEYREALQFCGSHSGRDFDKAKETGLRPVKIEESVTFQEAQLTLYCEKIYAQDLEPSKILDPAIHELYPEKDYHRVYYGQIHGAYLRQE